ncbi:glycosyltransferase [Pseudactinotalea sp. Z1748]|uniref:glycosyltransferase n=1 Tax=Pseudactinotalea sp. Z1748 TaxID=3413027 RepID=UPI003C7D30A6
MRVKQLVKRIPLIARRDALIKRLRNENRELRRQVGRLGGRLGGRIAAADETDYGTVAEQADLVRRSGLFDEAWYLEQVPGASDPLEHYLTEGYRAGHTPHPCFDSEWYTAQPQTPEPLRGPALVHYLREGVGARISPHPVFRADLYAKAHPESKRHPGGALGHFLSGDVAPLPAVLGLPNLTSASSFLQAGRATARRIRASRGYEHLPRETEDFDEGAEASFKAELRKYSLSEEPLVSVILPTKDRAAVLPDAVLSVLRQTYTRWELIIVDDGSRDATHEVIAPHLTDSRIRLITHETNRGISAARNTGLGASNGTYVAFLDSDNTWESDFLELMVRFVLHGRHRAAYAMSALEHREGRKRTRYRGMPYSREALRERNYIDCIVILHERGLLDTVCGFDESLRRNVDWDYLIRLSEATDLAFAPFVATRYDLWETGTERITTDEVASYRYLIRQRLLVDWEAARTEARDPALVSVVLVANEDLKATTRTIHRALRSARTEVEVVVVDSKLSAAEATQLGFTFWQNSRVRITRLSQELPMELARNVGAVQAQGATLIFLPESTWVAPDWDGPLVDALNEFSAVQPLVLTREGTVWSAGVMRAPNGAASALFAGLAGDAPELRQVRPVPGVTPLVVAVRADEFLETEGFDPLFVQDPLGPDLSTRLARSTNRPSASVGTSVVALESDELPTTRASRWVSAADNERRTADRWQVAPEADLAGHSVAGFNRDNDGRLRSVLVHDRPGRPLRWAIKIGAPDVPRRARWGDWHFAQALRDSLERLGHQVTIDCRDAWYRETSYLDDVVLSLRGRGPYRINPAHVNLLWVISHPDEVSIAELRDFDFIFGASKRWCERVSPRLPQPALPLMQCTDHRRFNPGAPDRKRVHEVLAVANARGPRPVISAAIEGGIVPAVYGYRWQGLLPADAWKGENIPNDELPGVYRAAGVVLNDHWEDMRRDGLLSNRLFDLAACEARMISDYLPEISDVFGDAIPTYSDPQEVPGLIRSVLSDGAAREQARRDLGELVRTEHTFDARAREISDQVANVMEARKR